jgi:hypothetical protein
MLHTISAAWTAPFAHGAYPARINVQRPAAVREHVGRDGADKRLAGDDAGLGGRF